MTEKQEKPRRPGPGAGAGDGGLTPLRIAGIYYVFAVAWIIVSDAIIHDFTNESFQAFLANASKGVLFMTASSVFLYLFMARMTGGLRRAEAKYERSDALLRKLSQHVPGVIFQYQQWPDGRSCFPYASESIREIYEVTPEQVRESAADVFAILHPDDMDRIVASIEKSIATMEPWECVYRVRLPKRGVRWLEGRSTPERMPDGSTLWHGHIHDVTERRAAEDALRASEERYRAMIALSAEAIWRFELDAPVDTSLPPAAQVEQIFDHAYLAECNDVMARMYGLTSADELLGVRLPRLMPRSDLGNADFLERFIRAGYRLAEAESHEIGADGAPKVFLNTLSGVIEGGKLVRAWGTQRDVTDQRRAEVALRASEERYRTLVEHAPEAIVIMNLELGRFVEANPKAERLYGLSREALLHTGPVALSPPTQPDGRPSAEAATDYIGRAARGETPVFEWLHRTPGGEDILCEVHLVRLPSDKGTLVRGSVTDIRERKRAETRQALLMQELNHRVKNNLAAVLALAERSFESRPDLAAELAPVRRAFTGRIMALSGLHTALSQSKWEGVSVRALVEQTVAVFVGAGAKRLQATGPDVSLSARAGSSLCMVLHELGTNAVKYGALSTPEGTVSVEWAWERDDAGATWLRLSWRERAGPRVVPPAKRGFGTSLIEHLLRYEAGGQADLRFEAEGLECDLRLPQAMATAAGER